jgi:outer membrane protein OmpA-like peptidoglycan-associated protein
VALLQKAATQMKQLPPGTKLEIAGYTDNNGDAAANVSLSQQRAEAVRNVLVNAGVDPSMLSAKGYGGANPVANNDLLEGRLRNRRIEYRLAQL